MRMLVYIEKSMVRGGIEVFAERHIDRLRDEGHEVVELDDLSRLGCGVANGKGADRAFDGFDEIVVHKCSDVATLERFPPERTTLYVHDHEPICPRTYAYTPFRRNCTRPGGIWPCIFCAPVCRNWKAALVRVFAQRRRIAAIVYTRMVYTFQLMYGVGGVGLQLIG